MDRGDPRLVDPEHLAHLVDVYRYDRASTNISVTMPAWALAAYPPGPGLAGKTIREINVERGRESTVDNEIRTILEMMIEGNASMAYHFMSVEDVETILRYPNAAVASDGTVVEPGAGKPHPRSYGNNARVLEGELTGARRPRTPPPPPRRRVRASHRDGGRGARPPRLRA